MKLLPYWCVPSVYCEHMFIMVILLDWNAKIGKASNELKALQLSSQFNKVYIHQMHFV